jgi:hypothetical protein
LTFDTYICFQYRLFSVKYFRTKSVDIHDKSSNWGPQQGAVPVDPFFNKKFGGGSALPDPDIASKRKHVIHHATEKDAKLREAAVADPVASRKDKKITALPTGVNANTLTVTPELLQMYVTDKSLQTCSPEETQVCTAAGAAPTVPCKKFL